MASAARSSNTPAATHSSRRARNVVSDTTRPMSASTSTHEHPVTSRINKPREAHLVLDTTAVTAQRMAIGGPRQSMFNGREHSVHDGRVERAHDVSDLRWFGGWGAPGIKTGPTTELVDGHLSARPLSHRNW